ncbi:sensor histidine kinase [Vibrio nereis]|uniref:ATPase n=1 Tax=Vibrio nereis TaxID=693 RepID=A0A0M0HRI2_VIBNE|nr:histidine kinase [Vibrio nereis]KOO04674.1 ATPase [Vibrio nereis]
MSELQEHAINGLKSLAFTSLFCVVIAFSTQTIWNSAFLEHLKISLGYGISAVLSAHIIAWFRKDFSPRLINLFAICCSMVFGTANAYYWLRQYDRFADFSQLKPVIVLGLIFTSTCFLYFYAHEQRINAQKQLERSKRIQSEQEKALLLGQLKQLQSQIEPHFLFNTLANISVLIDSDSKSAKLMLEKLTELLRGTLTRSRQENTTLQGELDLVDAYLAIQKIRLGERLAYHIDNQVDAPLSLPPLILQPLVENAIQHGIEPKAAGGCLDICAQLSQDQLLIEIKDNGLGFNGGSAHVGHGIGLANIRERLKALYGNNASLSLLEAPQGGVIAKVSIARSVL